MVQCQEPVLAGEDVVRAGECLARQESREHARAGGLAGLRPLGQGAIQDALPVARRVAVGDAQSVTHLLGVQAQKQARGDRRAEHSDAGGAVPAAIHRGGQRDPARHVQAQGDGADEAAAVHGADRVRHRQSRGEHGNPRMDGARRVVRVVEGDSDRVITDGLGRHDPDMPAPGYGFLLVRPVSLYFGAGAFDAQVFRGINKARAIVEIHFQRPVRALEPDLDRCGHCYSSSLRASSGSMIGMPSRTG